MTSPNPYPILYSEHLNPFSIRARMALHKSGMVYELREINVQNRPDSLENIKLPVFELPSGKHVQKSLDMMIWALKQKDPEFWLSGFTAQDDRFIRDSDHVFVKIVFTHSLEQNIENLSTNEDLGSILHDLNIDLNANRYLGGDQVNVLDVALFPHIRHLSLKEPFWFDGLPYTRLHQWLSEMQNHPSFKAVMADVQPWEADQPPLLMAPFGA